MPAGPSPKFSPRQVFTDHNFEGDAFLKGLGNANVSPFKDAVAGFNSGLQTGEAILGLMDKYGPAAQEAKRIALQADKERLRALELKNEMGEVEARTATALEVEALETKRAELDASRLNAITAAERNRVRSQASRDLTEIGDARSLSEYLQQSNLGVLYGDKDFASSVRTKAGLLLPTASPEEQVALIQAAESVSPGSGKQLEQVASPQAQQLLLSPRDRAAIRASDARATAALNRPSSGKTGEESPEISAPAKRLVDRALAATGPLRGDERIGVDDDGNPGMFKPTGEKSAVTGKPKEKFYPFNKLFGTDATGDEASSELTRLVEVGNSELELGGGVVPGKTYSVSGVGATQESAIRNLNTDEKYSLLAKQGISKEQVRVAVNARLRAYRLRAIELNKQLDDLKLNGQVPVDAKPIDIGEDSMQKTRSRIEAAYLNARIVAGAK